MNSTELYERIQRYRSEYLETKAGNEHYQRVLAEHREVQARYRELTARRNAGEDVTDDTLRYLLPYQDTEGNRQREVRVSTWPVITKNVKTWFQGANWKTPSEWPQAAKWLLDIVTTGANEDWEGWHELATQPIQKGFACGFITPIVHCLNPQLPVINSKVVATYKSVATALGLNSEITSALDEYPINQGFILQAIELLNNYRINDLLEWDIYCHWNVAKRLGGKEAPLFDMVQDSSAISKPIQITSDPVDNLCNELITAKNDTNSPDRLEIAVASALNYLGLDAEKIGGPGKADVVAKAALGEDSFILVFDAKTSQVNQGRGNFGYDPIKKHQEQYEANYAIVVADAFSTGDTISNAEKHGVGLLQVDTLVEWLRYHAAYGLSLYRLKELLSRSGVIEGSLSEDSITIADLADELRIVLRVFEVHQRDEPSEAALTPQRVSDIARGMGYRLSRQSAHDAIMLLVNPYLSVLMNKSDSYVLTIPAHVAYLRLMSLGSALSMPFLDEAKNI